VVEDVDVQQASGGDRLGGEVEIVGRRRGVLRLVAVREDHATRVQADGVPEQLAHPNHLGRHVALGDHGGVDHVVSRVERQDPRLLAVAVHP
jgi:hypothetical protein